jgi:GNAT superfamily N-acetyltransferase
MSDISPQQPPSPPAKEAVTLRAYRPEDGPWIAERHGALYHREFGWDLAFADLVAAILADMERHFDPARERCWIAERGAERLGCVALLRHRERAGVAKLRILLVEPAARGLGLGERLVAACTTFAREAGYHTITLWTVSSLTAARRLYQRAGYQLVAAEPEHAFGRDLVNETWELHLNTQG